MILDGEVPDQPRGKNIPMLQWDEKLAAEAKRIAETCEFAHKDVSDSMFQIVCFR